MTLQQWAENGWLRPHETSPREIDSLLAIVARDLEDAASGAVSADWRFGIAYNAALKLCTVLLHASGYRAERHRQHYRTLAALPLVLGAARLDDAAYLDTCRIKRNTGEYDMVGAATDRDADELLEFCRCLKRDVVAWLNEKRPDLSPDA